MVLQERINVSEIMGRYINYKLNFFSKFFFLSGFFFTNIHYSQDSRGRGDYFLKSSLPLSPASQTPRHHPGNYWRELISAHS